MKQLIFTNSSLNKGTRRLLLVLGLLATSLLYHVAAQAEPTGDGIDSDRPGAFPVPTGNPKQLFYLQRTPNTNTIVYELNTDKNGKLDEEEPIHVFWLRYPEGGMRKELSFIQRHFAYGVSAEHLNDGRYSLSFAAYKKKKLYLAVSQADHAYHVTTLLNNKPAILTRVFIQIDPGGSFWSPNVRYIELKGKDLATGVEIIEHINIAEK